MSERIETWRRVWRDGFLPHIQTEELIKAMEMFAADDPRITQGSTTTPPPLMAVQDWPIEAGCLIGLFGAIRNGGFQVATVGEAEECFAQLCYHADQNLGEVAACRWLLNWFDDTPRPIVIREMLSELNRAIAERTACGTRSMQETNSTEPVTEEWTSSGAPTETAQASGF